MTKLEEAARTILHSWDHDINFNWQQMAALRAALAEHDAAPPRELSEELLHVWPLEDWHEDDGPVMWWELPLDEPPWVGTPLDSDWPGHHTHWSKIIIPAELLGEDDRARAIESEVRK